MIGWKKGCLRTAGIFLPLMMAAQMLLPVTAEAAPLLTIGNTGDDTAVAIDPVNRGDSYSAVLYNNMNGLPTSEANDIVQTADGFIWIGSYAGLIRYDGDSFVRMDASTGISSVVSLHVDEKDRLWIGMNDSGLAMMDHGDIRFWTAADGLTSSKICDIAEDSFGNIYAGTTSGIAVIDENLNLKMLKEPLIRESYVDKLREGADGRIYGITYDDDVFVLDEGKVARYISHRKSRIPNIVCLLPDPADSDYIYIGTDNTGFYHASIAKGFADPETIDISPMTNIMDIQQFRDQVWISGLNGIGILDSSGFHMIDGLPMNNLIGHITADYEGNLWFTSTRQGVMKIVPNQFVDLFERYGIPETVTNSTCMYHDQLFVAADSGLIVLSEDGPVTSLPLESAVSAGGITLDEHDLISMLRGNRIRSVIRDSKDNLWISTWRGCGLLKYDGKNVIQFTERDGLFSDHIRAVCERNDGAILVVNSGGVCVIENDEVTQQYGKDSGIANPESLTVSYGLNGDIVLGSNGGGIYVISEDGTRTVGSEEGLSSGIVMRIKRDIERDLFWIVTSNSIAYMTPDYKVTTIHQFPYSNNYDLYQNNAGDMWVLSSNGIYVVPVQQLLDNEEINPVHYSLSSGLPCVPTGNSYSELTEDGDLYIAGSTGAAKVNIDSPMEDINELKVSVPYVDADGVRLYPDSEGHFTIDSSVQKLTIYSYVYNYSLTDPQVSYRLEGFDRDSVTVKRSELGPVDYTNLPGGNYHFVIRLMDSLGMEDRTVSIAITKEKALHEQGWFYFLIGVLSLMAIGYGVKHYIDRKTRAMEKEQKEAVEKERLNTELQTAAKIQASILPHQFPPFPERKEFDIFAAMIPAREVGGDFYDFFLIDEDHLCLVIADVSGKGIPASLFMMISKTIVQSSAMLGADAAGILASTNAALCSNNQVDMFVTVWLGILEISTGKLTAANAGHEYPALMKNGRFELLKDKHGFVIGGMEDAKYHSYDVMLEPGDKIFVYTDGVPEATDAQEQMFGTDRMLEALNQDPEAGPVIILDNVQNAVNSFVKDAEQFDDLTMLCLTYNGPQK